MRTIFIPEHQIDRGWYIVDADNVVLGRLAARVVTILRGKHRPLFSPHTESGDRIIIVNAEKIRVTGDKLNQKTYFRHSGFPGGLKEESLGNLLKRKPRYPVERAIRGMLPKGRLGRKLFKNVKIYAGPRHPHSAQKPLPLEI